MISTVLESEEQRNTWFYFLDLRIRYAVAGLFAGLMLVESSLGKTLLALSLSWLAGALALDRMRPADQTLDAYASRDFAMFADKALQACRPSEDEVRALPLVLSGPVDLQVRGYYRLFTRPRTGKDGRRRSPVNQVMVLLPLEDRLGLYTCLHDSVSNLTSQISAEEHHYRDVTSIALESDRSPCKTLDHKPDASPVSQILTLELTSGRRLTFPASAGPWSGVQGDDAPPTNLEKTVRAIQTLVRGMR